MVWSYSGDPSDSDRDEVRFLIGDTNSSYPLVQNEEVDWALTQEPQTQLAGALLLEHLATKTARLADMKVGDVSKSLSKLTEQYEARAKKLRTLAAGCALPFFGGLSKAGKEELAADSDAVQPNFEIGMDDHPNTNSVTNAFTLVDFP